MKDKKTTDNKKDSIYKQMGFMCGLEIHQRLATQHKLFCSCITRIVGKSTKPIASVTRYQRAVAGELGTIDKSAEFEEIRNRSFVYNIFEHNTCLVDIDEEPPHNLNAEALEVAMALSSAMGMHFIDEIQPMRKGVIDGSDPSAFQRTMIVGLNGTIKVNGSSFDIPTISLEEESSGIQSNSGSTATYNTDRLGIPLIEIQTGPYIPDPKTAKDIALYIGTLLRLTGKVQRGIGSIRQDVNLSIKDGARVEIKGVQELESIDKFIENEIKRQQNLLEIKGKLIKANANVGNAENITPIFKNTNVDVIKYHTHDGAVLAFSLKGFKGILGFEINPNRRVGTEISDYAKMAGVHGIIHSDEDLSKYKFSKEELDSIKKQLKISESESFIIIAGKLDEVTNAAKLAIWRAEYLMKGIPKETRVAHDTENYTSKFMRPLPTGSRMYPETDVRPTSLTSEMRSNAEKNAPNIEKETKYINSKIKNKILAEQLILSPRFQLFKTIIDRSKADPEFVANVLIQKLTEMRRNGIDIDSIKDESIIEIFNLYAQEKITKQAVEEAIKICSKSNDSIDLILSKNNLLRIKGKELNALIEKTRKESKSPDNELRNKLMSKYRLNVDGSELNSVLNGAK